MNSVYLLFFPLTILTSLMAYAFSQNPRGWVNRLFALYMLNLSVAVYAMLVIATTPSHELAIAFAAVLMVTIYALNSSFLVAVILALYYRSHLTRWYGLPLLAAAGLACGAVIVADILLGWGLFVVMPEMGHGYVASSVYMHGWLVGLLWAWLFGGIVTSLVLLGAAWRRSDRGERAPITWLIVSLVASGAITPFLPPHPLSPTLNPVLFSIAFSIVVGRNYLFLPAEITLQPVLRNATEGLIICNRAGLVEQVNPAAERLTGVSAKDSHDRSLIKVLAPFLERAQQQEGEKPLSETFATAITEPLEAKLHVDKPELLVLEVAAIPIHDERGRYLGSLLSLRDITERERIRQHLEAQARLVETIRELSAPIIPVLEGILILPLVGSIDSERAQVIMEDMLRAIRQHRARAILIDVTGVPVVDTGVANYLMQAVQAARLLGCQGIMVGIRAEIAQTLVQLGVNLGGLVTKGSLQDGLEYAVQWVEAEA